MRYLFVPIALFVCLGAIGLGIRSALQPPAAFMIVPGATHIEVLQPRMGERIITYHTFGPAYAWRATVERDLASHGWTLPAQWRADMPSFSYTRISLFWFGAILDRADLDGAPNTARIRARRWVTFPCVLLGPSQDNAVSWLQSCS
jgi:hypothetical protein